MINFRFVIRQLGLVMLVFSASLLLVTLVTMSWLAASDTDHMARNGMLIAGGIGAVLGMALWLIGQRGGRDYLGRREALLLVALSWLLGAALAGTPFWVWATSKGIDVSGHPFQSVVDCYFEAMSGLTTTGATVLGSSPHDIESLPRVLLLWRATTQWLGGLGIVVLFVAVLPTLGVGGKKLFAVETAGLTTQGVRPRIRETARVLWLIYLSLTIVQILVLKALGMDLFDAVCHTFATLSSGGFSTHAASVGHFGAPITVAVTFFMVLAGVNFGIYYQILRRNFRTAWRNPELRLYVGILLIATLVVAWFIYGSSFHSTRSGEQVHRAGLGEALRHGFFQVVSIQTGTGFCTTDFDQWSTPPKTVLLILMFIGASAGSTCGGIKVIRCLVMVKVMFAEIERIFRPNVVRTVKVGSWNVDPELRLGTIVYVLGILLLALMGAVLLMIFESNNPQLIAAGTPIDFTTAASASVATLNNIGPGLGLVGAVENYGWFSAPSKIVMSLLMVLGRLEVYAILVLFVPVFWRDQ